MNESEFAKVQLREHLASLIIPPISDGFWSIVSSANDFCIRNNTLDQVLRTFQNMVTRIPDWSDTTLQTEVERIQKVSKCGYLDDLVMGVFISYMKTFASLHYNGNSPGIKIEFERPPLKKFIHELYKCSARKLWQTAYLFRTQGVSTEQQARNRQEIEKYISDCMEQVIRSFLPWESITRSSFATEPSKNVVFNEEVEEAPAAEIPEYEPELEAELEEPEKLKITDESDNISIEDLDEKQEEIVDIDSKISEEGLVIKL